MMTGFLILIIFSVFGYVLFSLIAENQAYHQNDRLGCSFFSR